MVAQQTPPARLYDSNGKAYGLQTKPFAVGGEGSIHDVLGASDLVAKFYTKIPDDTQSKKIRAMAALTSPDLLSISAWPSATLHLKPSGGPIAGILMPRIQGFKEIHHLYSVAQRKKDYPEADWRFLIHAAINSFIAFETVHKHGHLIGDVNQKNVLVSNQALVRFVDCDSFQIRAGNGTIFRCTVGVPEYTPPELQGVSFRDVNRDVQHDNFGLAILIFHLLMMGRHPYSGRPTDNAEVPLAKAIAEGRFAYGRDPAITKMLPPPSTLPISFLSDPLYSLFTRAFTPVSPGRIANRPSPSEWKKTLTDFVSTIKTCQSDKRHFFTQSASSCPWCELQAKQGIFFFIPAALNLQGQWKPIELDAILADLRANPRFIQEIPRISAVLASSSISNLADAERHLRGVNTTLLNLTQPPSLHPDPVAAAEADVFFELLFFFIGLSGIPILFFAFPVGVIVLMLSAIAFTGFRASRVRRMNRINELQCDVVRAENEAMVHAWQNENQGWLNEYQSRKQKLDKMAVKIKSVEDIVIRELDTATQNCAAIRAECDQMARVYRDLIRQYHDDIAKAKKNYAQTLKEAYLASYLIRDAKLPRLGTDRITNLASFGIETAADVGRLDFESIPNIGPASIEKLKGWRDKLIMAYNPNHGQTVAEINQMNEKINTEVTQKLLPRLRPLEESLADRRKRHQSLIKEVSAKHLHTVNQLVAAVPSIESLNETVTAMECMLPEFYNDHRPRS